MDIVLYQGRSMYHTVIRQSEEDVRLLLKRVNESSGLKETDTGLSLPAHWDLAADREAIQS